VPHLRAAAGGASSPPCWPSARGRPGRAGPIVQVQGLAPGETGIVLERLLIERSLSVNTAAAGGNASLMSVG